MSEKTAWRPVSEDKKLYDLAGLFAQNPTVRAVPVVGRNGAVIGVVSGLGLLQFIWQHAKELPQSQLTSKIFTWLDKTKWKPENVCTIKETQEAIDGFLVMTEKAVAGIPVVDSKGVLVGCLSSSDIKGSLEPNLFSDLYLPVCNYLDKNTPQFLRVSSWIACTFGLSFGM